MSEFRRWKGDNFHDQFRQLRRALVFLGYGLFGVLAIAEVLLLVWLMSVGVSG